MNLPTHILEVHPANKVKGIYSVTARSPFTGDINTMYLELSLPQFESWINGVLMQDAFPQLSPEQREFIKTGITAEEWEEFLPPEEE